MVSRYILQIRHNINTDYTLTEVMKGERSKNHFQMQVLRPQKYRLIADQS